MLEPLASYFFRDAASARSAREVVSLTDAKSITIPFSSSVLPEDNSLAISCEDRPLVWSAVEAKNGASSSFSLSCGITDMLWGRKDGLAVFLLWVFAVVAGHLVSSVDCGNLVVGADGGTNAHDDPADNATVAATVEENLMISVFMLIKETFL